MKKKEKNFLKCWDPGINSSQTEKCLGHSNFYKVFKILLSFLKKHSFCDHNFILLIDIAEFLSSALPVW